MQTTTLKAFAQDARRKLIEQISNRLEQVLRTDSLEQRERKQQIEQLKRGLEEKGKAALVEEVAYTWFNRLVALRFMDANDYTRPRVLSPADGETLPEILQQAKRGLIEEDLPVDRKRVLQLLNGELPSADPQNEAYQLLLIAACNQWHRAMPFMFQRLQDYTELLVPNDLLSARSIVQDVREGMSGTDAQNVEIIGWLYQFYISEKKDAVFAAKGRVAPADLPAATQLFTPRWIVEYMVQNTLGKLWLQNRPNSGLRAHMPYYIDSPAAQAADFLRIDSVTDIRFLDQACGSGHILLYAFELLTLMYEEEGYGKSEIPQLILQHNLRGFEIDERAAQLAGFALMMKARGYHRRIFRKEARPHILQFQDLPLSTEETAEALQACGLQPSDALRTDLEHLQQATNLGSLIQPQADAAEIGQALQAVAQARATNDVFLRTRLDHLHTALQQLQELGQQVHCVVDNPPYMGGGKMNKELAGFVKKYYPESKADLMTCFMEAALSTLKSNGYAALINLPSWLFLSSFEGVRNILLTQTHIDSLLHMGRGIFGIDWGSVAFVIVKQESQFPGRYFKLHKRNFQHLYPKDIRDIFLRAKEDESLKINFDKYRDEEGVASIDQLVDEKGLQIAYHARQQDFQKIPGSPIGYWLSEVLASLFDLGSLKEVGVGKNGITTGSNERFLRSWYEVGFSTLSMKALENGDHKWIPYRKGGPFKKWYGNDHLYLNWKNGGIELMNSSNSIVRNQNYFFRKGITWSLTGSRGFGARLCDNGGAFDVNGMTFFPAEEKDLMTVLGLLNTKIVENLLELINPTLAFQSGNIESLPLLIGEDLRDEISVISEQCIDLVMKIDSGNEASIRFENNGLIVSDNEKISDALKEFQELCKERLFSLKAKEELLNKLFIDYFSLGKDFSPIVGFDKITELEDEFSYKGSNLELNIKEVLAQFISYAVGCMMGRYSLDKDGLILANAGEGLPEYWSRTGTDPDTATFLPDEDGIIPLLAEDYFPDDVAGRFRRFLEAAFGPEQFEANLQFLEKALGRDIRSYFVREFYKDHLKRYKKRPIYWLFSSPGKHFQALVYVHRYRPDTVSRLLNDYVRDFIRKLEAQRITLVEITLKADGSPREQTQAQKDIDQIDTILEDVRQYERDILYPLAARKLPLDLDDGVLVNYNKMGRAVLTVTSLNDAKARKKVEGFDWVDFDWGVVV